MECESYFSTLDISMAYDICCKYWNTAWDMIHAANTEIQHSIIMIYAVKTGIQHGI